MTNNRDPFNYTANLILRAKPDFEYAREAISIGVDQYLLQENLF